MTSAEVPSDESLAFDESDDIRAIGVNVRTGSYLAPDLTIGQLCSIAEGLEFTREDRLEIARRAQARAPTLGVAAGINPNDLAQAGWGLVFSAHEPRVDVLLNALEPLLRLRKGEAGHFFKVFRENDGMKADESGWEFLARHGAGPGPVNPQLGVPYYLLLVGDAALLPFEQQCVMDVRHAIGRLDLDTLDDVAGYSERVARSAYAIAPQAAFWGTRNPGDLATQRSCRHLIAPLARKFALKHSGWRVDGILGEAATKASLRALLHSERVPNLLMTASHGAGYGWGDVDQREWQGALVTQEWPGPLAKRQLAPGMLLGASDIDDACELEGMIALLFACYGAGTPEVDHYLPEAVTGTTRIASSSFTARLAKRMLVRGAAAVVGHVERVWTHSFLWPQAGAQIDVFHSLFDSIVRGDRLGAAMEYLNNRFAELASYLDHERRRPKGTVGRDKNIAFLWTASADARNYVVIGDPAVRLAVKPQ